MMIQDALDRIEFLCHQHNSVEDVDAYQTLKKFVLAQQSTNSAMVQLLQGIRECRTLIEIDNWQQAHFAEIDKVLDQLL